MIKIHYDDKYEYYLSYFEGIPVKILRDRKTGEILFDAGSVAECLGYESTQAMMSDDQVLDTINQHTQETGTTPLRRI
ncbi:hypothetical protein [Spirosoma endophyticum]|uniref:Uncharacterized protein n=1 Tax=Spirosoma endophyticum TaxID=662367 RepID=A0A1I2HAL1_9BACT|nr:hypothetical protein [Spirosoma endophyticum]SFF25796.1 hypothetical protein SAMN05216167_13910 [Spirosoma endophyticum]